MKYLQFLAVVAMCVMAGCSQKVSSPGEAFASTQSPPSASSNNVWVHGAWRWDKKAEVFTWRDGYWASPKKKYVAGRWVETRKGMKYVEGRWR